VFDTTRRQPALFLLPRSNGGAMAELRAPPRVHRMGALRRDATCACAPAPGSALRRRKLVENFTRGQARFLSVFIFLLPFTPFVLRVPVAFLITSVALRVATALVCTVFLDRGDAATAPEEPIFWRVTKRLFSSDATSWRRCSWRGAKGKNWRAIRRCASSEKRTASQGEMNHELIVTFQAN
jgi:hypothetical protein